VMKDVYGMEEMVDENPTLVKECLFQLEQELTEYAGNDKIALELARKEHTSFFEDEKFRLKFLRTDNYNPKRAARRIVRHLEIKLDLFGPDKLAKTIWSRCFLGLRSFCQRKTGVEDWYFGVE
jgi:hypothetical protein